MDLSFNHLHGASSYLSMFVVSTSKHCMLLPHGTPLHGIRAQSVIEKVRVLGVCDYDRTLLCDKMGDLAAEEEEARRRAERFCC